MEIICSFIFVSITEVLQSYRVIIIQNDASRCQIVTLTKTWNLVFAHLQLTKTYWIDLEHINYM